MRKYQYAILSEKPIAGQFRFETAQTGKQMETGFYGFVGLLDELGNQGWKMVGTEAGNRIFVREILETSLAGNRTIESEEQNEPAEEPKFYLIYEQQPIQFHTIVHGALEEANEEASKLGLGTLSLSQHDSKEEILKDTIKLAVDQNVIKENVGFFRQYVDIEDIARDLELPKKWHCIYDEEGTFGSRVLFDTDFHAIIKVSVSDCERDIYHALQSFEHEDDIIQFLAVNTTMDTDTLASLVEAQRVSSL